MLIPHPALWQEMLRVPQFVRFLYPNQDGGERHPSLAIKASSLLLKYVAGGARLTLFLTTTSAGCLLYALHIEDDPEHGVMLWSLLTADEEADALLAIQRSGTFSIYLFNEACANCAWTTANAQMGKDVLKMISAAPRGIPDASLFNDEVEDILERVSNRSAQEFTRIDVLTVAAWRPLTSNFVLNGIRTSFLNLLSDKEGGHQEQLALTLLGDLSPMGAYANTQLRQTSGNKEFMDVVLTYENGTVLVESKALSIFHTDGKLPRRTALSRKTEKATAKACNQLRGAARTLRENVPVFDEGGQIIRLERNYPPHAIVLVPDLSLLSHRNEVLLAEIAAFRDTGIGYLHILDVVQLFRAMQAARMLSDSSSKHTPMTTFDYCLLERWSAVQEQQSINVNLLYKIDR